MGKILSVTKSRRSKALPSPSDPTSSDHAVSPSQPECSTTPSSPAEQPHGTKLSSTADQAGPSSQPSSRANQVAPSTTPSSPPIGPTEVLPPPLQSGSSAKLSSNAKRTVFIVHASEDKLAVAVPLREMLMAQQGFAVFVAETDMPATAEAEDAITSAMESADIAVIVLSPEVIARKWPMKAIMCFLRRREEAVQDRGFIPVIIPFFYRLAVSELRNEPRIDRLGSDGRSLYLASRFLERMGKGEPEADAKAIKAAMHEVHDIGLQDGLIVSDSNAVVRPPRRQLLLQLLCDKIQQSVHPEPENRSRQFLVPSAFDKGDQSSVYESFPIQARVDRFRRFFPRSPVMAVLDFDSRDEDGNPSTPEGLAKHLLLNQASGSPNVVSIRGMGGVGKSTIMRGLSVDKEVRMRFPDGIHVIMLGMDASTTTLLRQICQVLLDAGAENTSRSLLTQNDIYAALDFFEIWFERKRCGFFIDDLWVHTDLLPLISRLCIMASGESGNSVLITTREYEAASLAPRQNIVRLQPRETRGQAAQHMLFFHSDHDETNHSTTPLGDSIIRILDICAGLPVLLAVAGKGVKSIGIDMPGIEDDAWRRYLSRLGVSHERLLLENVGTYGNLVTSIRASIALLDEQPQEKILGFVAPLPFSLMFRRLCVLRKEAAVPFSMLKHLWLLETDEQADVLASVFIENGLASLQAKRVGEDSVFFLSLHSSLHDVAMSEARRHDDTQEAHESLLSGYSSSDPEISSELGGSRKWWSPKLEPDGYIHLNVCRHLLGAGRADELLALLMSPQWAERQVMVNGVMFLVDDLSLGIRALDHSKIDADSQECAEFEKALHLISDAVALSSGFVSENVGELSFQLHGRLKGFRKSHKPIQKYLSCIETDAGIPSVLCESSLLGEAGGAMTSIVSVGTSVQCMAVMTDSEHVACGCKDGTILVVDARRGVPERQWKAHDEELRAIAVSKDRKRIVSGSKDKTAKVWDHETGSCVTIFEGHSDSVSGVVVLRDGRRVISVSCDGFAMFWNIETGHILSKLFTGREVITSIAMLGDEKMAVIGGGDKKLRIWNLATKEQAGDTFDGHEDTVTSVAVTYDGKHIVSGSYDRTMRVYDVGSRQQIRSFFIGVSVECVAVSGDGRRIVCGSWDHKIRIWDLESGTQICDPLEGHTSLVTGVAYLGDADRIMSCSLDQTVRTWDTLKKQKGYTTRHEREVSGLSFTPDGRFVVSSSLDTTIQLWDTASGQQIGDPLRGHSKGVNDVAVTPNGRHILSVSDDQSLRVWDFESRELLCTFTGHTDAVECVAVTPQGDHAVTGSRDNTVRVWDLAAMDGSHFVLEGHSDGVNRIFVSDDGLRIISADNDDNIFVWELETKKLYKRCKEENSWQLSRREVLNVVGETTVYGDTPLSLPLAGFQIVYGTGRDAKILATLESRIQTWALSPARERICVGLADGQVAFLKLVTEETKHKSTVYYDPVTRAVLSPSP